MKEILIALINEALWPATLLICFLVAHKELLKILNKVRGVKAGTVELELAEELHETGIKEQQISVLKDMTSADVDLFLMISYSESFGFKYDLPLARHVFKIKLEKLQEAGLLVVENLDSEEGLFSHYLTDLGIQVRELLLRNSQNLLRASATLEAD